VARYLQSSSVKGAPIFSLRFSDETFDLARKVAVQSSDIMQAWKEEQSAANTRKENRYQVVLRKKTKMEELKSLSSYLESQLDSQIDRMVDQKLQLLCIVGSKSNKKAYSKTLKTIASLKRKIESTEQSRQETIKPPPALLQPLPANEGKAMPILFFIRMPRHFQVLSRLSFMAQQMLLPRNSTMYAYPGDHNVCTFESIDLKTTQAKPKTRWVEYYAQHNGKYSPVATYVEMGSKNEPPGVTEIGPLSVMDYTSSADGVWHPDILEPDMHWSGGVTGGSFELDIRSNGYFDPFTEIDFRATVVYFTETLPACFRSMQWCLPVWSNQLDTWSKQMQLESKTRGNLALAVQYTKPKWLSKKEFLSFGALRAFPNQQDRKICVALHDRSLPLENVSCILIPSAMYCIILCY